MDPLWPISLNTASAVIDDELMDGITIKEYGNISLDNPVFVEGLPDVGLVGVITTSSLIDQLNMELYGHIESDLLPAIMVLHRAELLHPVRLYASGDGRIVLLTSEIALMPTSYYPLAYSLIDWAIRNKVSKVISVNGYPVPNRLDIKKPQVFGVGNGKDAVEFLRKHGVEVIEEGFIAGFYALLLRESKKYRIPGLALLGQSFPKYPDPGAAASVIDKLAEMLGIDIDVKPLLEKEDEIKLGLRDLMKQTEGAMRQSHKVIEEHLPAMYR